LRKKTAAIEAYAKEQKCDSIITQVLIAVAQENIAESLPEVVRTYSDLLKRVRCEMTADVTFGRIPSRNEVVRVKQLLSDLRSPTQYYIHSNLGVDNALGGGVVINAGDFELDGSLETRCREVKKHLSS